MNSEVATTPDFKVLNTFVLTFDKIQNIFF